RRGIFAKLDIAGFLCELTHDPDPEVRAQAAKTLDDTGFPAMNTLQFLLDDKEPRVRFHAAVALSRIRLVSDDGPDEELFACTGNPFLDLLRHKKDADPYLRHAAVMGLASLRDPKSLLSAAKNDSVPVRLGALLALRRMEDPGIAAFLSDVEPRIVE